MSELFSVEQFMAHVEQLRRDFKGSKGAAEKLGVSFQTVDRWRRLWKAGTLNVDSLKIGRYRSVTGVAVEDSRPHGTLIALPPPDPEKIKEDCVAMLNEMVEKGRVQSLGAIEQLLRAMSQGRSSAKRKRA